MKMIKHPNLVKIKEVINDEESHKLYIAMEFCAKGPILKPTYFESELKESDP